MKHLFCNLFFTPYNLKVVKHEKRYIPAFGGSVGVPVYTLHKRWSFLLRISSVKMTKSAENLGFGHIYWRNPSWKVSFFVQWLPVGWKTLHTCASLYTIQKLIVYQHSAPTKVLLRYTGLYNHGNDQTIFLFMEKRLGDSKYIYWNFMTLLFLVRPPVCSFLSFRPCT